MHSTHRVDGVFAFSNVVRKAFYGRTKVSFCGFLLDVTCCIVVSSWILSTMKKEKQSICGHHGFLSSLLVFFMWSQLSWSVDFPCGYLEMLHVSLFAVLSLNDVLLHYGKNVALSTVGTKVVMDSFYKHVFCDFSFATPFTSRYQAIISFVVRLF